MPFCEHHLQSSSDSLYFFRERRKKTCSTKEIKGNSKQWRLMKLCYLLNCLTKSNLFLSVTLKFISRNLSSLSPFLTFFTSRLIFSAKIYYLSTSANIIVTLKYIFNCFFLSLHLLVTATFNCFCKYFFRECLKTIYLH